VIGEGSNYKVIRSIEIISDRYLVTRSDNVC